MESGIQTIAVFGSSQVTQESETARQAEALGRLLAQSGFLVCTGGYAGVMEAASRGAARAGGTVIGVTCSSFKDRTPNAFLTKEICTDDLTKRIAALMSISDGYIVLDGGIGTVAELLLAWNMNLMQRPKPLIVVGEPLQNAVRGLVPHTEINERMLELITFADDVQSAAQIMRMYFAL